MYNAGIAEAGQHIQPFVWGLGLRVKSSSVCIRCSGLRVLVASLLLNTKDKEDTVSLNFLTELCSHCLGKINCPDKLAWLFSDKDEHLGTCFCLLPSNTSLLPLVNCCPCMACHLPWPLHSHQEKLAELSLCRRNPPPFSASPQLCVLQVNSHTPPCPSQTPPLSSFSKLLTDFCLICDSF